MTDTLSFDTAVRAHHPDSPSSLQSSEACPGFVNEQRESLAAEKGVLQHKAAETRDLSILEDPAQIAAVQSCIQLEDQVIEELEQVPLVDGTSRTQEAEIIREKYLNVGDDLVEGPSAQSPQLGIRTQLNEWLGVTGGFPDTLVLDRPQLRAAILDWKFGAVPVTPTRDNLQGKAYALATFQAYPTLQQVRVIFYHPHQGWSTAEQTEKYDYTFTRDMMPTMELEIRIIVAKKRAAARAIDEKADFSTCQAKADLCIWCARKGYCPAAGALIIRATTPKHALLDVPQGMMVMDISSPETLSRYYKAASQIEPLAKAIRAHCTKLALSDDSMLPEGWKIVRRQERSIKSLDGLIEAAKRHGVTKKELESVFTLPISKVEELVKKKAGKGLGAAAVRGFAESLESLGAIEMSAPSHFLQEVKTPAEKPTIEAGAQEPVLNI